MKSKIPTPGATVAFPFEQRDLPRTAAASSTAVVLAAINVNIGESVYVEAVVRGHDATADEVSWHRTSGLARNAAGTTTLIGADVNSEAIKEGSDDSAVAVVIDDTSDTIRVQATGNSTNGNNFEGEVIVHRFKSVV